MIVFPNCKINLGLHILRKRADGYHDLDTVFYPLPLQDALEIIKVPDTAATTITVSGSLAPLPQEENICYKAWQILKKDFPNLSPVRMHLHKNIPSGAGLGGGSADGAFALQLLNQKLQLGLDEKALLDYALLLGSDCPFFIKNKPVWATGRGELMEEIVLDLSPYKIVLVNPKIHIATAVAFSGIQPQDARTTTKEIVQQPIEPGRIHYKMILKKLFLHSTPNCKTSKKNCTWRVLFTLP